MFTDAIKIAVKTGLIITITVAVIALFNVEIPAFDTTLLIQGINASVAILMHWIPVMGIILPFCGVVLGFELAYKAFQLAMIAIRWIMKVNE